MKGVGADEELHISEEEGAVEGVSPSVEMITGVERKK